MLEYLERQFDGVTVLLIIHWLRGVVRRPGLVTHRTETDTASDTFLYPVRKFFTAVPLEIAEPETEKRQ